MEKLLQLLNEYLLQTNIVVIEQEIEGRRDIFFENEDGFHAEEAEIISKKFGFIQWLVGTNKIDHLEFENFFIDAQIFGRGLTELKEHETLVMLLSIQDDPIGFLVSVLKCSGK